MNQQFFDPSSYTPHAFIKIGRTGAMFTLRTTFLQFIGGRDARYEEWSHYVQNLGTTADVAFPKAENLAKKLGLELSSTREKLAEDLREIERSERRTSDEIEADRIKECFENNMFNHDNRDFYIMLNIMDGDWAARLYEGNIKKITDNIIPFGKHKDKSLTEINLIDRNYLEWMSSQDEKDCNIWNFKIQTFLENNDAPLELNEYVGNVKDRLTFEVVVKSIYYLEGVYGTTALYTMRDSEGHTIITFYSGSKMKLEVGESYDIKGTVKSHKEYRDVKQTVLTRVSLI